MVPSQKQNYANLEEAFLDQGWLTFFNRKKNTALGDEAEEQTIPAQEQDSESQKIFCNSFFCL